MKTAENVYNKLMAGESRDYNIKIIEESLKEYVNFINVAKNTIDKAHTLALGYAVLRGNKVYLGNVYSDWQQAHIEFEEALKTFF